MLTRMANTAPQIKICVPVDRHTYGPHAGKVSPDRALMQKADVLDLRDPSFLMAYASIKNKLPIRAGTGVTAVDENKIREVVAEGKEVIYHHGGGFAEDHVLHIRAGKQLKDAGMIDFMEGGSLEALSAGGISFASFGLCSSSRNAVTTISPDGMNGVWGVDRSPASTISDESEWIDIFGARLEAFQKQYLNPLGFENNPWKMDDHERGLMDYVCRIDFINTVFRTFPGIYLHLDIAHAKLSAWNIYPELRAADDPVGAAKQYMEALPLGRVKEIHISGTELRDGWMYELHNAPAEEDHELLRWLLPGMPQLEYVESEDYKSSDKVLLRGMDRLRNVVLGGRS